jgi:hypothetical protein
MPVDLQSMVLKVALEGLGTMDHISDVKDFFAHRDTKEYQKVLEQQLESLEIRVRWAERDRDDIRVWLTNRNYLP